MTGAEDCIYPSILGIYLNASAVAVGEDKMTSNKIGLLISEKRWHDALLMINEALEINPTNSDAYKQLAKALEALGRIEDALEALNAACFFSENPASLLCDMADIYMRRNNYIEAENLYRQALTQRPDDGLILAALALALTELGSLEEARQQASKACLLSPEEAQPFYVMGSIACYQGSLHESISCFQHSLAIDQEHAFSHTALGIAQLMSGNWSSETWEHYAWRFRRPPFRSPPEEFSSLPVWQGDPARAKVLVWGEQGIGDMVFSLGFLPYLGLSYNQILLCLDERLIPLIRRSFPAIEVTGAWPNHPSDSLISHTLPCCSLAGIVLPRCAEWSPKPYLGASDVRKCLLAARLRSRTDRLLVGISWKSGIKGNQSRKAIPLTQLAFLASMPNIELVSLQYGDIFKDCQEFRAQTGKEILDPHIDCWQDIDGLAALIAACDLVITINNSTAHLAGAMGKKGIVVCPTTHGLLWYWSQSNGPSRWYPNLTILRTWNSSLQDQVLDMINTEMRYDRT